jgi:hypothetical protein
MELEIPQGKGRNGADLLTEIEARQQELPMSLPWFRKQRVLGYGPPFVRVGNRIFYRREDLRRWVATREVRSNRRPQECGSGRRR